MCSNVFWGCCIETLYTKGVYIESCAFKKSDTKKGEIREHESMDSKFWDVTTCRVTGLKIMMSDIKYTVSYILLGFIDIFLFSSKCFVCCFLS